MKASSRTGDQLVVVNPANGERIGTAPVLDAAAVVELAARGRAAQPGWNALGFEGRAVILCGKRVHGASPFVLGKKRAMSFWSNNGDPDPQPALGNGYERLRPVAPQNPAVPDAAPGALRLPISPA
ncbi:hypothetical protein AB0C24_11875 [Amycolatopsis japonica]|uniref:hypothetical protein n=1 Tax=Amycolatopsis japonica TaxID=208439 RepID=UPI0033D749E1